AKYSDPGGRIEVMVERDGEDGVLRVRDTGIGISPAMLPRVFELFTQAERGPDRAEGGLGIGLTVARTLVELHGGRIEARSEGVGKGAEFVMRVPALPARSEESRSAVRPAPAGWRRARVLLVEDNVDAAESLRMLLELLGHHVRVAHDGLSAFDVADADPPDVMLIDIGLPGLDGYEVARRIRRHPHLKRTVLVALTGYGREEDRHRALSAGFDHHLVKPVDVDTLQGLVQRLREGDGAAPSPSVH
ncbi:MAG: response regulator, partial [Candidatus Binatia bacterium]